MSEKKKSIIIDDITFLFIFFGMVVILVMGQTRKRALQYSQEYILGQAEIVGNVDVQAYATIYRDTNEKSLDIDFYTI